MDLVLNLFVNYGVLAIIFIIGLIVCLEDFKFGKIRNRWIKFGFIAGLAFYFLSIMLLLIIGQPISWQYHLLILTNTGIAFVFGFILWHFKLWAGGDAKLFTLYVFLIPIAFYSNWYFKYWPPLSLLINIILPIFVYLLIKMLLYPVQLLFNYLKNPKLLKEYCQKYKDENKVDKGKVKNYLNTALSFLLILIFFQLLRTHTNEFLSPYLGNFVYASYFFMGFVIFKPLRAFLKKRVFVVLAAVILYFVIAFIYFRETFYADLHKIFALQFIFMLSYFYIFKYGRSLGQFLYNSAEVKMVPFQELSAGVYINKNYIQKAMGSRTNLEDFKKELEPLLAEDEKNNLWQLIDRKTNKTQKEKQQYQLISLLRNFRLDSLSSLVKYFSQHKKQKDLDEALMNTVSEKISAKQKEQLQNLLNNSDETKAFLKSIRGKLTEDQAKQLKAMIEKRNQEIKEQGHPPIEQVILHKTFSFAPWMLLGVIITLLTKTSLINLVYQYILHR